MSSYLPTAKDTCEAVCVGIRECFQIRMKRPQPWPRDKAVNIKVIVQVFPIRGIKKRCSKQTSLVKHFASYRGSGFHKRLLHGGVDGVEVLNFTQIDL